MEHDIDNVLLTGACGNLGRRVYRTLVEAGFNVRATDRSFARKPAYPVDLADLTDIYAVHRLVGDVEAVVHLANDARMWLWHDVNTCYTSNLLVNTNVFQAARMAGVKRIVFASSIQAISGSRTACDRLPSPLPYLPIDGKTPANPSNFYGLGKAASEQLLRAVCEWSELTGMALRLPAVWIRSRMYHQWLIRSTPRSSIKDSIPIDECLAWISDHDACGLITACLKADVTPGYHCYLPAGRGKYVDIPWDRIVADHFRGVELRADPEKLDCLVDIRSITDEIGWEPQDTIEAWLKEVEALSE